MPAYRSSTSGETASGTSHIVTAPSGIQDGDILLVSTAHATSGTAGILIAPAGWSVLEDGGGTSILYWKIASGEGASWTWTSVALVVNSYIAVAVSGAKGTVVSDYTYVSDAGGTDVTAPTVTPETSDDLLICFFVDRGSGYGLTTASGMTEFQDVTGSNNYTGHSGNYQVLSSSSATGTRTATNIISASPRIGYSVIVVNRARSGLFFGVNH
jgi:hypothetical protein